MTEDFQARASASIKDAHDPIVPKELGVGILAHETDSVPALLLLHLAGRHMETRRNTTLFVALDPERAVGLIIQLRATLLDAGVDGDKLIAMMKEASARFDKVRRHVGGSS